MIQTRQTTQALATSVSLSSDGEDLWLSKSIDRAGRFTVGIEHAQSLEILVVVNLTAGIALGEQLFCGGCR
jgi:hypothetical protein